MISEAVHIGQLTDEETMNSRREWSYLTLNKVDGAGCYVFSCVFI